MQTVSRDRRNFVVLGLGLVLSATVGIVRAAVKPAASIPVRDLIEPADLVALLKNPAMPQPVLLHVGFRKLYQQAHIPGSDYAGPAGDEDGLKALAERVAKLPLDGPVVIYCGCCPWSHCPNIAAAYDRLHDMGFTQVRALHIEDNFGANWVDKGYPAVTSP